MDHRQQHGSNHSHHCDRSGNCESDHGTGINAVTEHICDYHSICLYHRSRITSPPYQAPAPVLDALLAAGVILRRGD
ncbi:MAG: hypothetical protein MJ014_00650 [Methanocorpusculum sp.]|nr:hypothetical protein [Methanocorpusculum sp.]